MLKVYPKIDVHCHTTGRLLTHTVSKDASLSAIFSEMTKHDIRHTLVLATYFPKKGTGITNYRMKYWIDLWRIAESVMPYEVAGHYVGGPNLDRFIMFGSLDFEHYFKQGFNELEEMADRKLMRGVKIYAGYQSIVLDKLETVLKLCQKYKLPVMAHTGDCIGIPGAFGDISGWDKLVEKYHDVNFMYSHLCNPFLDKIIQRVKRYPNVYTDISGLLHSKADSGKLTDSVEYVKKYYGECGIGQLMFGTDFPVQTHADSVYIARLALQNQISDSEAHLFYYGTAARLLSLEPAL